jgi:hypothetical protein
MLGAVQSWVVLRRGVEIYYGINHLRTVAAAALINTENS